VKKLRIDLNKDSKQLNLNPNPESSTLAQLQASCGFGSSKHPCSTISPYLMETNPRDAS